MFGFLAQLLAWCYDLSHNYAIAIALFTMLVMLAVTPLTIKGMRSMAEMARLQPEIKRVQDQFKNDKVRQNEEMQALFKEHKVNPLGGCLPTLLPLPIFFILFRLLRGLGHTVRGVPRPNYLPHNSRLYTDLVAAHGKMQSFGMDLARAARDHHASVGAAIPYFVLIVIMTVSQYWQQRQMNARNPQAANANPQMKLMMQIFPAFYALISLTIPASVVLYLLISGLFRMTQNSLSYKFDPRLARAAQPLPPRKVDTPPGEIETTGKERPAKPGIGPEGGAGKGDPGRSSGRGKGAVGSPKPTTNGRATPPANGRATPPPGGRSTPAGGGGRGAPSPSGGRATPPGAGRTGGRTGGRAGGRPGNGGETGSEGGGGTQPSNPPQNGAGPGRRAPNPRRPRGER